MSITALGTNAFDDIQSPLGSLTRKLGGSCTHFSLAARHFTPVTMIGVVGEDMVQTLSELSELTQLRTDVVRVVAGELSFHWQGAYEFDLNSAQTLKTNLNVLQNHSAELPDNPQNGGILFLANDVPQVQLKALQKKHHFDFTALDSMNLWIATARDDVKKAMSLVDLVTLNEGEARQLTGEANLLKAGRVLLSFGPRYVVIKRGEYGCLMMTREGDVFCLPALPLEHVFDPTGAGDSFAGGFLGYMASQKKYDAITLRQGLVWGTVMASFTVEEFGCSRLRRVTASELQERYNKFISVTQHTGFVA